MASKLSAAVRLFVRLAPILLGWPHPSAAAPFRQQAACVTERISLGPGGIQANASSFSVPGGGMFSADGRWVAFWSQAANLVPGDVNMWPDVFVRDRWSQETILVSVSDQGDQGNGISGGPTISFDGRLVAYQSSAQNLVPNDTNGEDDIFVRDRWLGTTERVSISSSGQEGNHDSWEARICGNGRFVAFWSRASNLVANDMNGRPDIFRHDRQGGQTVRVNISSNGDEANGNSYYCSVSADGRFVAFESWATNLVPGDTNGTIDVFVHDTQTGLTSRVSVASGGRQGNFGGSDPAISGEGRYVAFQSSSNDLVPGDTNNKPDIFVHDRQTLQTVRVNIGPGGVQANSDSVQPSISADGRHVAFQSSATNLVPGGSSGIQVFVHDLATATTTLVSASASGSTGNAASYRGAVSPDGKAVAFESYATNLVPGDTNGWKDVFVRDCAGALLPRIYCAAKTNSLGCTPAIGSSGVPSASLGSGFFVAATSVLSQKPGLLLYSLSGSSMIPFQNGWLCAQPPLQRTPLQISGGNLPTDCSGVYQFDFNAWIASGTDPALAAGISVWSQYWSRDPGLVTPDATGLTDALAFTVGP